MSSVITYKARVGNALPVLGNDSTSNGVVFYSFGVETQEVISCNGITEVAQSTDMCLQGGEYFSAQYKAYPGKVNGQLKFSAIIAKKPVLSNNYGQSNAGVALSDKLIVDSDF